MTDVTDVADGPPSERVALVTGASTGIGREICEALAGRGWAVAGLARGSVRLERAMAELASSAGARTLAVAADVTDREQVDAAAERVVHELGPVDLLVNCAGLVDAAEVPVWDADPGQWWDVVSSHVLGAQLVLRALVPGMLRRGTGRVVNLASGMGTRAVPEYSAYSVAKAAQMRLTEALAASLEGTGVLAFNIAPGLVETDMTRSMPKWSGHTDWTPPDRVVELVCAVAEGRLDAWSGCFLRAGVDRLDEVCGMTPDGAARRLRLLPYGPDDPLG